MHLLCTIYSYDHCSLAPSYQIHPIRIQLQETVFWPVPVHYMFTLRITSDLFLQHVAPKEQQNATTNGYPICLCVRQRRSKFLTPLHLIHSHTLPGGDILQLWGERAPTSACLCPTTSTSAFSLWAETSPLVPVLSNGACSSALLFNQIHTVWRHRVTCIYRSP